MSTTDVVSTQISVLDAERRQSECRCRFELKIAIVGRLTWYERNKMLIMLMLMVLSMVKLEQVPCFPR